jgi:hypothetical protein
VAGGASKTKSETEKRRRRDKSVLVKLQSRFARAPHQIVSFRLLKKVLIVLCEGDWIIWEGVLADVKDNVGGVTDGIMIDSTRKCISVTSTTRKVNVLQWANMQISEKVDDELGAC